MGGNGGDRGGGSPAANQPHQQQGRLHKGTATAPMKSVAGFKPVNSIPSKFETVLFTGPREQKGFLSEAKRFNDGEHDLPGPGSYGQPLERTLEYQHDSISKKGYGPMVSRSKRFSTKVYYTGPGPTDYRRRDAALQERSFSTAAVSAAFQAQSTLPRKPSDAEPAPGPGAYNASGVTRTGAKLDYLSRPGAASAFKAVPHQLATAGNVDTPPSTSYNLADPWDKSKIGTHSPSHACTSSFGGGGGGRGAQSVGSMAGQGQGQLQLDALLFGPAGAGGSGGAPGSEGPGPGAYELQDFGSIKQGLHRQAHRPSPAFQQSHLDTRPDRGGLTNRAGGIGPQDAPMARSDFHPQPPRRADSPPKGVGAPFVSTSPGHQEYSDRRAYRAASNAPGPAYYEPGAQAKRKSFHANMRKQHV